MATLSDILTAERIGAQIKNQNDQTAAQVIETVAPYIDYLELEDNERYAQMSEDDFKKLIAEEGGKDRLMGILNSSPIATSYKDINTGQTEKGMVVGINETDRGISFDVQTKQGIFPKTMGFSNDPEDIVMFTNYEGLRTMANSILQKHSHRLTAQGKPLGQRAQAIATLDGIRENKRLSIAEKLDAAGSAPEAIDVIEGLVESGELDPALGFEMLVEMGSEFNDGLDAYREKLRSNLKENKETRTELEEKGKPGGRRRRMPSGAIKVTTPTGRTPEEQKQYEAAQAEAGDLRGRLKDSEIVFPVDASPEAMFSFIKQNEALMIEVGGDQNILDKARAAFNKYKVSSPEDLNKLPDYDSSIDVSKAEIAAAIAVTAGGDFSAEFQDAYRLLATGDAATSPMQVQQFDRASQDMNARLDQYITESNARIRGLDNDRAKDIATKLNSELEKLIDNVSDSDTGLFNPEKFKGKGSVNFRNIVNAYDQANQLGLFRGAEGLEMDGYFRNALGTTMFNLIRAEGRDPNFLSGIPLIGGLFEADRADMPLGDVTSRLRAKYKEDREGNQVLDSIIAVDSQGKQIGKELSGKKYSDIFNDRVTAQYISRYIQEIPGN
tara:strand:- start:8141 stop:9970 length:1830 start_codon:yes stop_codon:yes gene_type:complete